MPRERGTTRAIAKALIDGPDYGQLPVRAKAALLHLKVYAPPSGIEVCGVDEAVSRLLGQGLGRAFDGPEIAPKSPNDTPKRVVLSPNDTKKVGWALQSLMEGGWVKIEGRVLWIVRQLEFEPTFDVSDRKHRASVQSHVAGYPMCRL